MEVINKGNSIILYDNGNYYNISKDTLKSYKSINNFRTYKKAIEQLYGIKLSDNISIYQYMN